MEESYKYFAFISYSHRDEKWAKFIQNELEGYKLPNVIRKEAKRELPKRIHPVFRDATDLGVGLLEDNLKAELAASKYLIVICSPNSASENDDGKCWVDSEVSYFLRELNRRNRIIPIIIAGMPKEAFCKTLRQMECLALDATKHQKARIVNDVVAKILGLKPDDLWQRELRRIRRRRIILSCIWFAMIMIAFAGTYFAVDVTKTHVQYYLSDTERWGLDFGEIPVAISDVKTNLYYRFEYKGYRWDGDRLVRKLCSVVCLDGAGKERCFPSVVHRVEDQPTKNYSRRSVRYDSDGRISFVGEFASNGVLRQLLCYEKGRRDRIKLRSFDEYGNELTTGQLVNYLEFDEKGRQKRMETYYPNGQKQVVILDEDERPVKSEMFNLGKERCVNAAGFSIEEMQYNEKGMERSHYFYDQGYCRCAVRNLGNVSGWTNAYDNVNGRVVRCFLDARDCPVENNEGASRVEIVFNTDHLCVEKLTYNVKGDIVGGVRFAYDDCKRLSETIELDGKLQPTKDEGKIAIVRFEYDDKHNIERRRFFDSTGKPCRGQDGLSGIEVQKDDAGNEIAKTSLGADGKPCVNKEGFVTLRRKYDKQRRIVEQWCENEKGITIAPNNDGIKIPGFRDVGRVVRVQMDYNGQVSVVQLFEVEEGKRWRYARCHCLGNGLVYRTEWLDENKQLVDGPQGWAYAKSMYNDYGELIEFAYFNAADKLINEKEFGFSIFRSEYDHSPDGVSVSFHFLNSERFHVEIPGCGCAVAKLRYDTLGRLTSLALLDGTGKALPFNGVGVERMDIGYDSYGRVALLAARKVNGAPCELSAGCGASAAGFEYSVEGKLERVLKYDTNNQKSGTVTDPEKIDTMNVFLGQIRQFCAIFRYRQNFLEMFTQDNVDVINKLNK